jgi:RimJ/RimL family protein N-acetyltransferase
MMTSVYRSCPVFITPRFTLRLVRMEDAPGLLRVYSDKQAQNYFNADNCTSDFRYATLREMEDCVRMWCWSYQNECFVRWTIHSLKGVAGTVEMFRRDAGSDGQGEGILRIDVSRQFEFTDVFDELLHVLLPALHEHFGCARILTKAMPHMMQRRLALVLHGFFPSKAPLRGDDGIEYGNYWGHRYVKL